MRKYPLTAGLLAVAATAVLFVVNPLARARTVADYDALVSLFEEMRSSQQPAVQEGVPDYTAAAVAERRRRLDEIGARIDQVDSRSWPVDRRIDHLLVITQWRAYDFEHRVMRPWSRDPILYVDLVQRVPFTPLPAAGEALAALRTRLRAVPRILEQAKQNLTDGAGELTNLAIRNLEQADGVGHGHPYRPTPPPGVIGWYDDLLLQLPKHHPDLVSEATAAKQAVVSFRAWLQQHQSKLNAPAGIGIDNYDYYQRYIRLMPYTAEDNVRLGDRELARGRAFLALERHRNRKLPALEASPTEEEYTRRKEEADRQIREFIRTEGILTIPEYIKELDTNVPWLVRPGGKRNFWEEIQYRDPRPDHLHAVIPGHRFDGIMHRHDKRPIRGRYSDGGRSEGWGFYLEEAFLQLGLLDDRPRTRELFYLFLIKRASRAKAEVEMHANTFTVADAVKYMMDNVEFLDEAVARVDAEIYLRRPAYGSGYQMGKLQLDELLSDYYHRKGTGFDIKEFHDRFLAAGTIPISLIRWELLGDDSQVRDLWERRPAQSTRR